MSWFTEVKKTLVEFHQQDDPTLRVMVDLLELQQVEEVKDGTVLLFRHGGYARVNESYDSVVSRLVKYGKESPGV